ncbi:autotransporter outer membrane beta-barrel domain-containing protein, partial [Klebsiella michiganensis]
SNDSVTWVPNGIVSIAVIPTAPTVTGIAPNTGTTGGGTSVNISGTNFTVATAVKFGATNATNFTVNSATQITATSPAGSTGVVDVTVTNGGGTSTTSAADRFTYVLPPTAGPTSITVAHGSTNNHATVDVTGATSVAVGTQPTHG